MQSRKDSFKEATTNMIIGGVIAYGITTSAIYLFETPAVAAFVSVVGCTITSFVRQYFVRRWFNNKAT